MTRVLFEDLDFMPVEEASLNKLAEDLGRMIFPEPTDAASRDVLTQRICVVHDDVMSFLSTHATDVVARVALEQDTKRAAKGGLWHEENLPTETVLVSLVAGRPNERTKLGAREIVERLGHLTARPLQLGGKATVGRGRCRLVAVPAAGGRR